ncbi:MAG TPA: M48 family metallopeptidase [Steroidobacteraceae bacterium]|nr:M48 family metallopeptidase [Steroidobacteraceae bacterium]
MNFYARQADAHRQTRLLVVLFVLAVVAILVAVNFVVLTMLAVSDSEAPGLPNSAWIGHRPGTVTLTSILVLAVVGLASLYKTMVLRSGGGVVAKSLGGDRVDRGTSDPLRRRLHNVVEEMAIASGVPMPEVYVLEHEAAINAFAAGHTASNAAIAVTRGALEHLNRSQLQGVIAHEFSHVLNGDMRISLRLMGLLFGLLVIALIGRTVLRFSSRSSGDRKGGVAVVALAAVAVMLLGYIGVFFGRLIQAAVSRRREELADASAVQFTREPEGLKGALVKIGGYDMGSKLQNVGVDEVAHMLFASGMTRLFATHPPLVERIRALDPSFKESEFSRVDSGPQLDAAAGEHLTSESLPSLDADFGNLASGLVAAQSKTIARLVGNPGTPHVKVAQALKQSLPPELLTNLEAPGRALGMLLALVLDPKAEVRARQLTIVKERLGESALGLIAQAESAAAQLEPFQRLPLLQSLFPSLRRLTRESRLRILEGLERLIRVDGRIEIFEYALGTLARIYLQDELRPTGSTSVLKLNQVTTELQTVFSTLSEHGTTDPARARRAYEIGMHHLLPEIRPPYQPVPGWAPALDRALQCLDRLAPAGKEQLVEALVKTIALDEQLTVGESELLRVVCASIHCPLPPLMDLNPRAT